MGSVRAAADAARHGPSADRTTARTRPATRCTSTGVGEAALIDPSVTVVAMGGAPGGVDAVINSHSHEDHIAGNGFFADARVHVHEADVPASPASTG